MTETIKPFLIIYVPRNFKGRVLYQEHQTESKVLTSLIPHEIEEYFASSLAVQFHTSVSKSGFDLKYEFKHGSYGKILKTIKLVDRKHEVIDSAFGYNVNMAEIIREILGKLGMVKLDRDIRKQAAEFSDENSMEVV